MTIQSHNISSQSHLISWSFPSSNSNGKEKDYESGFHYYGARYYWSELLTGWLSVDPLADKYPGISPYAYCMWNPVKLVDPDGNEIDDYFSLSGKYLGSANWITDGNGIAIQHLQYLPFGEPFVNQRTGGYDERFTFTGKERDEETGYGYFGARYMDHELMTSFTVLVRLRHE